MATSTITQTLRSVTQAATGETDFFTLESTASASETLLVFINTEFTDTATAVEELFAIENQLLSSTAEGDGTPTFTVDIPVHETATGSSQLNVVQTTLIPSSYARARDQLTAVQVVLFTDTATAVDSQTTILSALLEGTGYASSTIVTLGFVGNQLISATAGASGSPEIYSDVLLAETAEASSSFVTMVKFVDLLADTALASDSQITVNRTTLALADAATAESTVSFEGSVYNYLHTCTAGASDWLWAKDFEAVAWVMNTETSGLSIYDNFQFTSIAAYNGVLYATSNSGIYALTGETDEGRSVDSLLKLGFLDFGRKETKRISDIFVGYTGGQLAFDVEAYDAPDEVYTYIMEEREAGAPRNNRVKPGRGLSSRYWRFSLKNIDGADFQVYDIAPNIAVSKRRL